MTPSKTLIQAVAVTVELTGTELSPAAADVMCQELADYPESQVINALIRCRRELKGRMSIADVISRLDDGRLGADEAWALVPKSESETVVWTDEISQAFFVARSAPDDYSARLAFRQCYERLVFEARRDKKPVVWNVSLGFDKEGREPVIRRAMEQGRIGAAQALTLLPHGVFTEQEPHTPALTHDNPVPIRALLKSMKP